MLRILTAGEAHGPALVGILEGLPRGVVVRQRDFAAVMHLRKAGYGRSARMQIETDRVRVLAGVRFGETLGTPLAVVIENRDFKNHRRDMAVFGRRPANVAPVTCPRPGHADCAGAARYGTDDLVAISERASARETAVRVALAVPCRNLLQQLGVNTIGYVVAIGGILAQNPGAGADSVAELAAARARNGADFLGIDAAVLPRWRKLVDRARDRGDTLGGSVEVRVDGLPAGLGSHVQADRRLDGRIAQALMAIPGVKAVEIGGGVAMTTRLGSDVRDAFVARATCDDKCPTTASRFPGGAPRRCSNHAGGVEGGVSNGEQLLVRCHIKPVPTLGMPTTTIDLATGRPAPTPRPRADVQVVPALAVIAESVILMNVADALLERFGSATVVELQRALTAGACEVDRPK